MIWPAELQKVFGLRLVPNFPFIHVPVDSLTARRASLMNSSTFSPVGLLSAAERRVWPVANWPLIPFIHIQLQPGHGTDWLTDEQLDVLAWTWTLCQATSLSRFPSSHWPGALPT